MCYTMFDDIVSQALILHSLSHLSDFVSVVDLKAHILSAAFSCFHLVSVRPAFFLVPLSFGFVETLLWSKSKV